VQVILFYFFFFQGKELYPFWRIALSGVEVKLYLLNPFFRLSYIICGGHK
jgi:hypothetical protein